MKKIYIMLVAALMLAIVPVSASPEHPQISVKNDKTEIVMNLTAIELMQMDNELLPGIAECKETMTTDITVKADADADVSLRLSADNAKVLNNYSIAIKDVEGSEVKYDGAKSIAKETDTYIDIPLGRVSKDTETVYTVSYKLIDVAMDMSSVKTGVRAKTASAEATQAPATEPPKTTLAPKFEIDFGTDTDTDPTPTPSEGKETEETKEKIITKICGKDIPAGRYTVIGNGHLKVTSANGQVKSSFKVAENLPDVAKSSVILLEKDDVLTITPLEGDEKAKLKFVEVTPTAGTTTTNKGNTPTPKKPVANTKTNPKTSDTGMGVVIGVGIFAILAVGGLEFLKYRKKKTNN